MGGGTQGREEGERRILKWANMVDRLHIPIWNRTKKLLDFALSRAREGWGERWWEWYNQHAI
jgi:hypothetical protein